MIRDVSNSDILPGDFGLYDGLMLLFLNVAIVAGFAIVLYILAPGLINLIAVYKGLGGGWQPGNYGDFIPRATKRACGARPETTAGDLARSLVGGRKSGSRRRGAKPSPSVFRHWTLSWE
jgi:hypothetical protein